RPEHAHTDTRVQIPLVGETAAVLFIGDEIGRQRQSAPGEYRHDTVLTKCADQARERHGGDMPEDRTPLQTEPPMGGQQGVAGHLWSHLAIAQDEVRQDGEHRATPGALDPPDGDPTEPDTEVVRMAGQAPTSLTRRLMCELKAEGGVCSGYARKSITSRKWLKNNM